MKRRAISLGLYFFKQTKNLTTHIMKQLLRSIIFIILIANAITKNVTLISINETDEQYEVTRATDDPAETYRKRMQSYEEDLNLLQSFNKGICIFFSIMLISGLFFCYLSRTDLHRRIRRTCVSLRNMLHEAILYVFLLFRCIYFYEIRDREQEAPQEIEFGHM